MTEPRDLIGDRAKRDPDNQPIDPELETADLAEEAAERPLTPWEKIDPDAYRPAITADDDELPLDPDDEARTSGSGGRKSVLENRE